MENLPEYSNINSHAHLYKIRDSNRLTQHEKRIQFLEDQKQKRQHLTDKNRQIYDLFIKQIQESKNEEDMEYELIQNKKEHSFKFNIMMTDWFTDIPDDLEENWVVKFAPEGFRILLIARNRYTAIYNKKGRFLFQIKSNFPGGGGCNENGSTVLDCIYNNKSSIIFILDCLFWNSMSTIDSEANFRFYWLKTKFEENPELIKYLEYKFVLMDSLPAERSLIQEKMFDTFTVGEHVVTYDGLVFYHKESQYTFGYTPLATWLASFMVPEMLGIDVPEVYLQKKPINYVNIQHYIENHSVFKKKRRRRNKKVL